MIHFLYWASMIHLSCFPPILLLPLSQIFAHSSHSLRLNVCVPQLGAGLFSSLFTSTPLENSSGLLAIDTNFLFAAPKFISPFQPLFWALYSWIQLCTQHNSTLAFWKLNSRIFTSQSDSSTVFPISVDGNCRKSQKPKPWHNPRLQSWFPITNLSGNPVGSAFKIYPKSNHFSPPLLLVFQITIMSYLNNSNNLLAASLPPLLAPYSQFLTKLSVWALKN